MRTVHGRPALRRTTCAAAAGPPRRPPSRHPRGRGDLGGGSGSALRDQLAVAREIQRPALIASDAVAHLFPTFAVPVEVTVLELHSSSVGRLRDEADFDLARLLEVALDLPLRADIPA